MDFVARVGWTPDESGSLQGFLPTLLQFFFLTCGCSLGLKEIKENVLC